MNKKNLEYLGDAVYAGNDGYQVWLTVNSHKENEIIAIEPDTLKALIRYAEKHLGFVK